MCGIAGYIHVDSLPPDAVIKNMTDLIAHRGPNGEGFYRGPNFVFGHRRLAIVDLSDTGRQPMEYLDRYVITYNGEVYNYIEIRAELETQGYSFSTRTDTEVIMAAYDCWGPECLNYFNGMWAFVIYDKTNDVFFIAKDRFGIKPLYYFQNNRCFVFASEIKAILSHPEVNAEPNLVYVNSYIKQGPKEYLSETAFKNIYRFPQASFLISRPEGLQQEIEPVSYWAIRPNLKADKYSPTTAAKLAQEYYELLSDAVKLRLRADVKVGTALSGGLDSSSIVYLVNKHLHSQEKPDQQETFSCVYHSKGTTHCDESDYISTVADSLNVHANFVEPSVIGIPKEHERMIWMMENPPDSTLMSSWHTFMLVGNSDVTVTLDGQGADEQLAGYPWYVPIFLESLSILEFYKNIGYYLRSCSSRNIFRAFLIVHGKTLIGQKAISKILRFLRKKESVMPLNYWLAVDTSTALCSLLHYADRTSMAHSVESRMPYMDYRLVEFLANVPACYKIHNGWSKYLARLAFDGKLPDSVCWRKDKMGWPIPESFWFTGTLKSWFRSQITDSPLCNSINPELDIDRQVTKSGNLRGLIRYLNIAVYWKVFFDRKCEL